MTGQCIQQEAICYQWFKQQLIGLLRVSKPRISQRSQIKEDTVELKPSVPAREFSLEAYAAIS